MRLVIDDLEILEAEICDVLHVALDDQARERERLARQLQVDLLTARLL